MLVSSNHPTRDVASLPVCVRTVRTVVRRVCRSVPPNNVLKVRQCRDSSGCSKSAGFNFPHPGSKADYCEGHRVEGMVCLRARSCEVGDGAAGAPVEGLALSTYCSRGSATVSVVFLLKTVGISWPPFCSRSW